MHHSRAHAFTKRHLFKFSLCTIIAAIMLALLPAGASSAAPQIEWFPHYRPQTKCSPKPKPGTVMLAKYLMRHYKGSGSLGISRSCGASGISEHKEGRAFDWALNARSRRDRHYAADFLHRMRKTDRYGHRDALARRMGIMYVIWNDHIYSATHRYRTQRYRNSGCKSLKRCSAALRHRNHMHISLTRPAAHERTSWYTRHSAVHSAHQNKKHHRAHHHGTTALVIMRTITTGRITAPPGAPSPGAPSPAGASPPGASPAGASSPGASPAQPRRHQAHHHRRAHHHRAHHRQH